MPDITMCDGEGCPKAVSCYRHTADPTPFYQTWFVEAPYDHETASCKEYWEEK